MAADLLMLFIFLSSLIFFMLGFLNRKRLPLPPGPPTLPFIGHMHIRHQLTHIGLARLANKYGGILYLRLGSMPTIVVSSPDAAMEVLKEQDSIFSNRPATLAIRYLSYDRSGMAFTNYGPFWRQVRKLLVMKLFSPKRAQTWASVRHEIDRLMWALESKAGTKINLSELLLGFTRNITFKAAFGCDFEDDENMFASSLEEFSKLIGAFNVGDSVPWLNSFDLQGLNKRLEKVRDALDRFTDRIIDEHMAKPTGKGEDNSDIVDELLAFLGDGASAKAEAVFNEASAALKLTKENVKAIAMDVMIGGTETVATALEWVMAELMNNVKEMEKVQEELKREVGLERQVEEGDIERLVHLKRVVKETLRLHPPIPILLHEAAEETQLLGYTVPARCRVLINVHAIGRNAEAWPDADKFVPDRFTSESAPGFKGSNFELIPFGSGRRSCPGMQLGLYIMELAVARMVHSFSWALPDGMKAGELDMSCTFGLTAPRAKHLEVVPTTRLLYHPSCSSI